MLIITDGLGMKLVNTVKAAGYHFLKSDAYAEMPFSYTVFPCM